MLTIPRKQTAKISDEEFQKFLKTVKADNEISTQEVQKGVLKAYKEILTD